MGKGAIHRHGRLTLQQYRGLAGSNSPKNGPWGVRGAWDISESELLASTKVQPPIQCKEWDQYRTIYTEVALALVLVANLSS